MENIFNLYLVRHGESFNNSVDPSQRVCDPPLTELGQSQAERLADRVQQQFTSEASAKGDSLDKVYTSAFLRTMQTIYPTTLCTRYQPEIWTNLFEVGGCFDGYLPGKTRGRPGMNRDEISQQFPSYQIPPDIDDTGWWKSQPTETHEQASDRADKLVEIFFEQFVGKNINILCVIHGDLIRLLMSKLVSENPAYGTEVTHNTSMTHLRFTVSANAASAQQTRTPASPQVLLFNDTSHLTKKMLSV